MNTLPLGAVLSLDGVECVVTIKTASPDDAMAAFEFLRRSMPVAAPAGDLIGRTGNVCSKSGVVKVGGVSQMQVGGALPAVIVNQGDGWFDAETTNDKTFRFDSETKDAFDGGRWFEFDEEG